MIRIKQVKIAAVKAARLFITYFIRDRKLIYLVLTALVCQLLFLAHPLVGITIFGIAILYVIYLLNFKSVSRMLAYLCSRFSLAQ